MTSLAPGQSLGHYRIVRAIGQGGMGAVFHAEDTKLDRQVALKVLPPEVAQTADRLERFRREAKAVAALNHPHIVTLYSVEEDGGTPFLTMEWVDGESLDRTLPPGGLPLPKVLEIGVALADALAAAHDKGIIHRDLKPANVVLTKDGRVKVLDFGLAKHLGEPGPSGGAAAEAAGPTATVQREDSLTAAGAVLGTVPYMSPEQLGGEPCDARTDVFSLGVVIYELATGRRPFGGKNKAETISSILRDAPRPLVEARQDAPRQLGRIIDHCLQKDPDARFQSAKDVRNELRALQKELDSAPVHATVPPPQARQPSASARLRPWIEIGAIGVAILTGAIWLLVRDKSVESVAQPPVAEGAQSGAAAAHETSSLAVLPFLNISSDQDQEYFSDGLTEELLNALVKIPKLKVAGRTSSFSFKGKSEDLRTIGEKLGVEHILGGSVRKAGDRIRVTAQLVKAADGFHLWSETYDRQLDDVFAVQDDIARSVAAALKVTLLGKAGTEKRPDAEAYDLVLQARFALQGGPETVRKAHASLERALTLAPDYAPAWAEMGLAHRRAVETAETVDERRKASDLSRQALARALELDPQFALARSRMAAVHLDDWEFEAAEREVERALAAAPRNPIVVGNAALIFDVVGRRAEAIALGEELVELDPLNPAAPANLAGAYLQDGRFEEAEALCRRAIELRPDLPLGHNLLAYALLLRGRAEEARPVFAKAAELLGHEGLRLQADALVEHALGHAEASAAAAREYEARFGASDPYLNATIRAWRGDSDGAFSWLDRAVAARDPSVAGLMTDPLLVGLHADLRWKPLLEKVGFSTD